MKKVVTATALVISLLNFTNLFAAEAEETLMPTPKYLKLSFDHKINFLSLPFTDSSKNPKDGLEPNGGDTLSPENYPQLSKDTRAWFSLTAKDPNAFSFKMPSEMISNSGGKKSYSKAAFEITSLNVTLWAFSRYIDPRPWSKISFKTMLRNITAGFEFDIDTFKMNKLAHPYHGAIHYSMGRANGLNFWESTLCSTFGSYTWEVFLESIHPSSNDLLLNTLGGITLGEVLFKIGDVLLDDNSTGFEKTLRKSLAFIINPAYGIKALSGKSHEALNQQQEHYYDFSLPFGAYSTSSHKPRLFIAADLEYKDFLRKDFSGVKPYDWFSLDCRFGIQDNSIRHKEIFSTGIIAGKRIKNYNLWRFQSVD
jgi:hypothetical protein